MPINLEDKTIKHWLGEKDHCLVCGIYYNVEFIETKIFDHLSICEFCKDLLEKHGYLYLGKYTENRRKPLYKVILKDGSIDTLSSAKELYQKYRVID